MTRKLFGRNRWAAMHIFTAPDGDNTVSVFSKAFVLAPPRVAIVEQVTARLLIRLDAAVMRHAFSCVPLALAALKELR